MVRLLKQMDIVLFGNQRRNKDKTHQGDEPGLLYDVQRVCRSRVLSLLELLLLYAGMLLKELQT